MKIKIYQLWPEKSKNFWNVKIYKIFKSWFDFPYQSLPTHHIHNKNEGEYGWYNISSFLIVSV